MDDICYRPTLQQVQLFEFMAYQYDYRTMPTTNKEIYVCVLNYVAKQKKYFILKLTQCYMLFKKSFIRYLGMMIRIACLVMIGCARFDLSNKQLTCSFFSWIWNGEWGQ